MECFKKSELIIFYACKYSYLCLICKESVVVIKEYRPTTKIHYSTKNSQFEGFQGQLKNNTMETLKEILTGQYIFFKNRLEAENIVRASFVANEKIVKHSKSCSDGEFVKECLVAVVNISCPNNFNNMHTISISRRAVTKRIDEIVANLEQSLRDRQNFKLQEFFLATDEVACWSSAWS
jgi:hypothetical protein